MASKKAEEVIDVIIMPEMKKLIGALLRITDNQQDAEDCVSHGIMQAYLLIERKIESGESYTKKQILSYVWTCAKNEAYSILRRRNPQLATRTVTPGHARQPKRKTGSQDAECRFNEDYEGEIPDIWADPWRKIENGIEPFGILCLVECVGILGSKQYKIFIRYYLDDIDMSDIARELKISNINLRVTKLKTIVKLRKCLLNKLMAGQCRICRDQCELSRLKECIKADMEIPCEKCTSSTCSLMTIRRIYTSSKEGGFEPGEN